MSKTLAIVALAALFAANAAYAAEPAAGTIKPAATAAPASGKNGALTQQDRMRLCSKQATGKKGQERKSFMKTCLSKKAGA
jgi:hypothetical protein